VAVAAVLALAVVPAYAFCLSGLWTAAGKRQAATADERAGLAYLRPLVQLLAATAELQSAHVRAEPPDLVRLRAAMTAVDRVDGEVGERLGAREQWAALRGQVESLLALPRTGAAAVTAVGPVLDLELAHVETVRDGAGLVLDPGLDSSYLLDAVAVHVPAVLVDAARTSDLRALAGPRKRAPTVAVAVAQTALAADTAALDRSLRMGLSATSSTDLAPAMIAQLDVLRVAVNAMAPPVTEVGSPPVVTTAAALRASQTQVRDAALEVASSGLDQVDELLRDRAGGIDRERRTLLLVTAAAVLLALLAVWIGTGGRVRRRVRDEDDRDDGDGVLPSNGPGDPDEELRMLARPPQPSAPPARALVRVGRAVTPVRDEP
jgi:hypothetical protein